MPDLATLRLTKGGLKPRSGERGAPAWAFPTPAYGFISHLIATADLGYIGLAPPPATHESRRNPGKLETKV